MGKYTKFMIMGDPGQVNLPPNQHSGLTKRCTSSKGLRILVLYF